MRLRAYKTKLVVNDREDGYLRSCAGAARFVFNWALADRKVAYENAGIRVNKFAQKKHFNALKKNEFPWLSEYPYTLVEEEFDNVNKAFKNFFRRIRQGGEKPGFPKFKSRHRARKKFTLRGIKPEHVQAGRIKLPRIGWMRLAERDYLPTSGVKILFASVSEQAGSWYISLQVEEDAGGTGGNCAGKLPTGPALGVDVGIRKIATCSDGTTFENERALYRYKRRMARLQRELDRRKEGSANRKKTKAKIAKLHTKITNVRQHALHRASKYIAVHADPTVVVIEDLNVRGMLKNRRLARSVSDASMSELHRQIEYKTEWNGGEIQFADRWFPSSKMCSGCGAIDRELSMSDHTYNCRECGLMLDRDLNAAKNLVSLCKN